MKCHSTIYESVRILQWLQKILNHGRVRQIELGIFFRVDIKRKQTVEKACKLTQHGSKTQPAGGRLFKAEELNMG